MTMDELSQAISEKAKLYLEETEEEIAVFPQSIVDFVVEYAVLHSNFPDRYTDDDKAEELNNCKNTMAMACCEVYSKIGGEGQKSHGENGVTRTYDSAWISTKLLSVLPNYVKFFS